VLIYWLLRKRADGIRLKNLLDRGMVEKVNLIEGDLTNIILLANALDES